MPSFEYKAVTANGKNKKGLIDGDSPKHARQQLKEQSLIPLEVKLVHGEGANVKKTALNTNLNKAKLRTTDLALITRQFATLLDSGLTIEEVLSVLIAQAEKHKIKAILSGVRSSILEGQSFSSSVDQYPRSFPEIYRAAIAAGENSGKLPIVMDNLANFLEERQDLQQKLGIALIYPIVLTLVSFLIVIALLTFVVPKVVVVFEGANQTLPILTRIMILIGDFLKANAIPLFITIAVLILVIGYIFRQPGPSFYATKN